MKRYRPRASFSVFTPEVHTTNHQRFQKKVDISHNLQYLCTPNQKVYHLQHPREAPGRKILRPLPDAKGPDGGIGRRAGLKHQWSNPCRFDPGSGYIQVANL